MKYLVVKRRFGSMLDGANLWKFTEFKRVVSIFSQGACIQGLYNPMLTSVLSEAMVVRKIV